MPRKATGSVRCRNDVWYARITISPKDRPAIALPTCRDEQEALARRDILSGLAAQLRRAGHASLALEFLKRAASRDGKALDDVCKAVERLCAGQPVRLGTNDGAETFKTFSESWTKGDLRRLYPDHIKEKRSVEDDKYRLKRLYDEIGPVPIAKFTLDDAERAMRSLPDGLSSASRRQYAQLIHRVLSIAVFPARITTVNPLPRGFLPSAKSSKGLTYLYPAEDTQLLACSGDPAGKTEEERAGVPLCYRVLYGFLTREGMRTGEAERLRWSDIAWTDDGGAAITLDENKTEDPRAWTLNPGVAEALLRWRKLSPLPADDDHVFVDEYGRAVNCEPLAKLLRAHLGLAKVERKQLFETTANRRRIRAHDLRATFITVSLATGRTETWVMDRTGHESSAMINRYRRAARSLAELRAGDLAPLCQVIPELAALDKGTGKGPDLRARTDSNGRPPDSKSLTGGGDAGQRVGSVKDSEAPKAPVETSGPASEGAGPDSIDVVEVALAKALQAATAAQRWDVVAQLGCELEARRLARVGSNVVPFKKKVKRP